MLQLLMSLAILHLPSSGKKKKKKRKRTLLSFNCYSYNRLRGSISLSGGIWGRMERQ